MADKAWGRFHEWLSAEDREYDENIRRIEAKRQRNAGNSEAERIAALEAELATARAQLAAAEKLAEFVGRFLDGKFGAIRLADLRQINADFRAAQDSD